MKTTSHEITCPQCGTIKVVEHKEDITRCNICGRQIRTKLVERPLFGYEAESAVIEDGSNSPYMDWKRRTHYRLATTKEERCKTCAYHVVHEYAKSYHKCKQMGTSSSHATDIRLRNVCDLWRKEKGTCQT